MTPEEYQEELRKQAEERRRIVKASHGGAGWARQLATHIPLIGNLFKTPEQIAAEQAKITEGRRGHRFAGRGGRNRNNRMGAE